MWQEVPCQGPDGAAWVINTGGRDAPRLYTVAHPRTYKPTSTFLQVVYNIKTHILTNFETQVVYNFVWTHKVYGRSFDTTVPLQTHKNKQQQQYFLSYLIHSFSRMVAMMLHFVIYVKAWSRVLIRAAPDSSFPDEGSGHSQLVGGLLSCGCPCVSSGLSGVFQVGTRCPTC